MNNNNLKDAVDPNDVDNWVDDAVLEFLNPKAYKSFFLFAGAGSGKTRTLVNVLARFKEMYGREFSLTFKHVAIITYTNAAADEITHRLEHDPIFKISTIHSFAWALIHLYTIDIKKYLERELASDISDLQEQQKKSKNLKNKASIDRAKNIDSKKKRLEALKTVRKFTYNPSGDNTTKDSLNHSEVISIAADFIKAKPLMQRILVAKFPVILIDESQDTKKELIDAFFTLQQAMPKEMSLGLFGDTMQRIYADGKENLDRAFPPNWETPNKKLNHRSNKRIIRLINSIREEVDEQIQQPRVEKEDGFVRLFICGRGTDKTEKEEKIIQKMSKLTGDPLWNQEKGNIKILILEHHMAAKRMGFFELFEPLHKQPRLRTAVLEGTLTGMTLLTKTILPLINAYKNGNRFEVTRILKKDSPMFDSTFIKKSENQMQAIENGKKAVTHLLELWDKEADPTIITILEKVYQTGLFSIPDNIKPLITRTEQEKEDIVANEEDGIIEEDEDSEELSAWEIAFAQPFSQVAKYDLYLSEHSKFGTHQGVKGLEYPRVMVIIDDEEAKGFMFSYDKLFGVKELSDGDQKNIADGKETGIDRTRRLFYVACSRARESLGIVAYAEDPELLQKNALSNKWFIHTEIEIL